MSKSSFIIRYNSKGLVIPPQTADRPLGFASGLFGFLFPLVSLIERPNLQLSPVILQYTPTFRQIQAAHLLQESNVAEIELLILIYVVLRLAIYPIFRNRILSQFSEDRGPPVELKRSWPIQITATLKFGIIALAISLTWGFIAEPLHSLTPKFVFCTLGVLGVSFFALTEGLMDFCLFRTVYRKYWRK
jgi:hypothetical protein